MRRIRKGPPPVEFEAWKARANEDWAPTYGDLRNPEKNLLLQALAQEQGMLCCYCGRRIDRESSHIEHFRPQHDWPELDLAYQNLHASCIRETLRCAPLHCGHLKDCQFDETLAISPLDPDCEQRFVYSINGQIDPQDSNDQSAKYMLVVLGLDIPFLRNRREQALAGVFDSEFLLTASVEDLKRLKGVFASADATGKSTEFGHVIARYAEQLVEALSTSHAQ